MFDKKKSNIPLDKFINAALYHPKKGYYMKRLPFGKKGDFVTSPNISKIFSEMIFIWIISYWKKFYNNKKINIVELGAGNGEMINQIIISSKKFNKFYENCNFMIYEKSKKLIQVQKKLLKKSRIKWLENLNKIDNCPTIFIGNEFLDALPIKQYININNKWHERYVQKKNGAYSFNQIKCNIEKLEKNINIKISKNQNFLEVPLEGFKFIKKLNEIIKNKGGCMLFIDYGYLSYKMYDTLQAVKNHKKVNVLSNFGSADICHLINIPLLKKMAINLNLEMSCSSQRNFLLSLGILQRAEILASSKNFMEKANIFYRINRLIDKKQMGELFKVIYFHQKKNKFKLGFNDQIKITFKN